jgi:hypothetical protein
LLLTQMLKRSREDAQLYFQKLSERLLIDLAAIDEMILLKKLKNSLQHKINEAEDLQKQLLQCRRGGSKKGRKIVMRNFEDAYRRVLQHYFVSVPLYNNVTFCRRFRVSRSIFDRIYDACTGHPYFQHRCNAAGRWGVHPLVKITAVFRQLAYGSSADELDEHFQISDTTLDASKEMFCDVVIANFEDTYLPRISPSFARHVIQKHEQIGWPGLFGSLDCSHWEWTRCPKSMHGEFKKGTMKHPSIVYECVADCNLRILHVSFAAPGSNNDINVLDCSDFMYNLVSGKTMAEFNIDGVVYNQPYVLVDGIYPEWSCFLKPLSNPFTEADKNYTKRQEARRKDVERAFGCLVIKWNILKKPSLTPNLVLMSKILRVCCILHNMHVEEKLVMEGSAVSVADAVFEESMASDQENVGESELTPVEPCTIDSFVNYFRHLRNIDMHKSLRRGVSNHLWKMRNIEANARFKSNFSPLFA